MTYIVFSYDVEDYVNPEGANGILRSAEILRAAGVRGCFNIVSRLAEALVSWGRQDVIEALKHHELELHSLGHSYHPTINEYTDIADFKTAMAEFLRQENLGRDIVSNIFDVCDFPAACPPGTSVSYVAHYGYAEMGIPIYTGDLLIDEVRCRPVTNCNIASLFYNQAMDTFLTENTREELEAYLDAASKKEVYVLYHHPQMSIYSEFWDAVNFRGKNTPPEQWKPCAKRPGSETELFYENFAWIVDKIKADHRFKIVTYSELAEIYCSGERFITPEQLPDLKQQICEYFFPVTSPDSYCISDIALACRDFLLGSSKHKCGKVYGFLETPLAVSEAVTVTKAEIIASAAQIGDGFLPASIQVGSQQIGPGDWLRAALEILCGGENAVITPADWQIDMSQFPATRDQNLVNTWIAHSPDFKDEYLSRRIRLQSWTYRLPRGTARKIFE